MTAFLGTSNVSELVELLNEGRMDISYSLGGMLGVRTSLDVRLLFGGMARLYGFEMLRRAVEARHSRLCGESDCVCGIWKDIV